MPDLRLVNPVIDHEAVLRDRNYRFRAAETVSLCLRNVQDFKVHHRSDDGCCQEEPWIDTLQRLFHICGASR